MGQYERLGALDASFLGLEDGNCHMHVGGVMIFDAAPVRSADGGIDIDRIRAGIQSRLHLVPRFRQRLDYIPYEQHPIWVDDTRFRLAYHVRHTALPHPGDERTLKRLVGRVMSQPLDRKRPLWEMWVVEGLEGDRFALVSKTHHCMIDGISGADLMSVILSPFPEEQPALPEPWVPRSRPTRAQLIVDDILRRAEQPITLVNAIAEVLRHPEPHVHRIADALEGILETLAPAFVPVSRTPLQVEVGPHRRFDWTTMSVAEMKQVKAVLGGTLNDLVLAIVSGGLRRFFARRGLNPDELEIRAMVPVSVRHQDERGHLGNRVTQIAAALPVHMEEPLARLRAVSETTKDLKESKQALGGEVLTAISDWTVPNLLVQAVRLASRTRPYNLVVTNVPGPQIPLYLLGARMRTAFPVVPLFENLGISIGLFSYDGGLFWGMNADWEHLPDLHHLVEDIELAFAELRDEARRRSGAAAKPSTSASAGRPRRRPRRAAAAPA